MATRSMTFVNTKNGEKLLAMYIHHDGYPQAPHGVGWRLSQFLKGVKLQGHDQNRGGKTYNAAGELAAGLVHHFFNEPDHSLIVLMDTAADRGEACNYTITLDDFGDDPIRVDYNGRLFETVEAFEAFCQSEEGE